MFSTACDFLTTAAVFQMVNHVMVSTASGAIVGGITNCCINYRWTFPGTHNSKKSIAWRYFIVWIGSILLNTGGTELLTRCIAYHNEYSTTTAILLIAKALVAITVAIAWNYTMQKRFVY